MQISLAVDRSPARRSSISVFSEKPLGGGREIARRESKLAVPNYAIDSSKKTFEEDIKIKAFLRIATSVVDRGNHPDLFCRLRLNLPSQIPRIRGGKPLQRKSSAPFCSLTQNTKGGPLSTYRLSVLQLLH